MLKQCPFPAVYAVGEGGRLAATDLGDFVRKAIELITRIEAVAEKAKATETEVR